MITIHRNKIVKLFQEDGLTWRNIQPADSGEYVIINRNWFYEKFAQDWWFSLPVGYSKFFDCENIAIKLWSDLSVSHAMYQRGKENPISGFALGWIIYRRDTGSHHCINFNVEVIDNKLVPVYIEPQNIPHRIHLSKKEKTTIYDGMI